jgi:RTA1 like protein
MLYGIIVQMIALTVYVALGTEFVLRYYLNKPVRQVARSQETSSETVDEKNNARPPMERNVRIMLIGLVINAVFFFIR